MMTIKKKCFECTKLLIDHDIDIDIINNKNKSLIFSREIYCHVGL